MKGRKPGKAVSEVYSVEKVLDVKIQNGKEFYFIKWLNYGSDHNSWEPKSHLNPALIEDYNEENGISPDKEKDANKQQRLDSNQNFEISKNIEGVPSKVVGMTPDSNEILVLVENEEGVSFLITRQTAHKICPQLLIEFYEDRLEWTFDNIQETSVKKEK